MKNIKVFLIVLIAILFLIFLCLIARIKISISLSENGKLTVKYLFLKFNFSLYNRKKQKTFEKNTKKKSNKPKGNYIGNLIKDKGVLEGAVYLLNIVKILFLKLVKILKNGKFDEFNLYIKVSETDAAKTALTYGGVCAVGYPIIGILNDNFEIKKENINIKAAYLDKNMLEFNFNLIFKVRVIYIIMGIISFVIDFLKKERKI